MISRSFESKLWFIGGILYFSTHLYCKIKGKHFIHLWYKPCFSMWISTIIFGLVYSDIHKSLK